jgi:hypothetical protein
MRTACVRDHELVLGRRGTSASPCPRDRLRVAVLGRSRDSVGGIVGAFVAFVFAIGFVAREYVHVQRLTGQCIASETVCHFHPEPFTRFCVYGFIAMAQAFVLFVLGAAVERRLEEAAFAEEWRR